MKFLLTSLNNPAAIEHDIVALRAEDASGSFGIHPGHADLLTVLEVGVLSWRCADGRERYCALRRAVLRVHEHGQVDVASREAIVGDDLARLEATVLARLRARDEEERGSRAQSRESELRALRALMRYLRPNAGGAGEFR